MPKYSDHNPNDDLNLSQEDLRNFKDSKHSPDKPSTLIDYAEQSRLPNYQKPGPAGPVR